MPDFCCEVHDDMLMDSIIILWSDKPSSTRQSFTYEVKALDNKIKSSTEDRVAQALVNSFKPDVN